MKKLILSTVMPLTLMGCVSQQAMQKATSNSYPIASVIEQMHVGTEKLNGFYVTDQDEYFYWRTVSLGSTTFQDKEAQYSQTVQRYGENYTKDYDQQLIDKLNQAMDNGELEQHKFDTFYQTNPFRYLGSDYGYDITTTVITHATLPKRAVINDTGFFNQILTNNRHEEPSVSYDNAYWSLKKVDKDSANLCIDYIKQVLDKKGTMVDSDDETLKTTECVTIDKQGTIKSGSQVSYAFDNGEMKKKVYLLRK